MNLSEIVQGLTALPSLTAEACEGVLGCRFDPPRGDIRRASQLGEGVAGVELRGEGEGAFLVVELNAGSPAAARSIGTLEGSDIVSPPVFDPARPSSRPPWDRKWSERRRLGERLVAFGFEERGGEERLVSFSLR